MPDCDGEQRTRHYRGHWYGFGPVRNEETVFFAVFATTKLAGDRLQENSFSNKNLASGSESIVRSSFVTKQIFVRDIGRDGESKKGSLIGFSQIKVACARELFAPVARGHATERVRAWCIEDRVEQGDCAGHATLGYAKTKEQLGLSDKSIGVLRKKIRLDLAKEFSTIIPIENHKWPSRAGLIIARANSIARELRNLFRNILRTNNPPT
jgi:hypothetical protein